MIRTNITGALLFFCALVFLSSCGKGYQVRFTNYYIEPMDSVVIGNNKVVFKNTAPEATTEFNNISKGDYSIRFISQSKKVFISKISIPKTGTGKRTIQIDGITQVSILEE